MATTVSCATMWIDHDKLGCGMRDFVVTQGRKWAHLIVVATGEHARVPVNAVPAMLRRSRELPLDKTRKRLRRNATTFGTMDNLIAETLDSMK